MLKRALRVALTVVVAATHSSWACAQSEIKTHVMDEQAVQKLATSLAYLRQHYDSHPRLSPSVEAWRRHRSGLLVRQASK